MGVFLHTLPRPGKRAVRVERVRGAMGLDTYFPADETTIHRAIYDWLRTVLPGAKVFHCPNGGQRDPAEAKKLKSMGVTPGVPDLIVVLPEAQTVWLEVKTQAGDLSNDQLEFHAALRRLDHRQAVVRSIDEARAALRRFGIETREAA